MFQARGARGANARQEEEEASQSAHAVASKHGAARWLVRLTRHAASFWVQLAVARLEVLLAYGCGDDGPETGDAGAAAAWWPQCAVRCAAGTLGSAPDSAR